MANIEKKYFTDAVESRHWEHRKSPALEYFELIKQTDNNPEGKKLLDVVLRSRNFKDLVLMLMARI